MFNWIAKRARRRRNAHDLYGSIVALARARTLYTDLGVPDTIDCRFEMLLFHVFVCLDRIGEIRDENMYLAQDLVDVFFADMDTTSRELGVGDTAVPKKMKTLAAVYDERMRSYKQALDAKPETSLGPALAGNILAAHEAPAKVAGLAVYARDLQKALSKMDIASLEAGRIGAPGASIQTRGRK